MVTSLRSSLLGVPHHFFTREGGVSHPPYDTLNGGLGTQDAPHAVAENRRRMAETLGVAEACFLGMTQVHGCKVVTVRECDSLWPVSALPEADALVSDCPDIALSVATADCAPVLLASEDGRVVGVAHAGWRGAVAGVLEQTLEAMHTLGVESCRAVVGPCIGPQGYETGPDMRNTVLANHPPAERFFCPSGQEGHSFFDLPGFCLWRLQEAGVTHAESLNVDTLQDQRFFSYRRNTLAKAGPTGRQISAIRANPCA